MTCWSDDVRIWWFQCIFPRVLVSGWVVGYLFRFDPWDVASLCCPGGSITQELRPSYRLSLSKQLDCIHAPLSSALSLDFLFIKCDLWPDFLRPFRYVLKFYWIYLLASHYFLLVFIVLKSAFLNFIVFYKIKFSQS